MFQRVTLCFAIVALLLISGSHAIFKKRHRNGFHGGQEIPANPAAGYSSRVPAVAGKRRPQEMTAADEVLMRELEEKSKFSSCWREAVDTLYKTCDDALSTDDDRSRLAIKFTVCQLEMDGKKPEGNIECPRSYDVKTCVASLGDEFYPVYVQFRIHANALCFHVEADSFQSRTLRTVANLDKASREATGMLRDIGAKGTQVQETLVTLKASHAEVKESAGTLNRLFQEHAEEHTENLKALSTNAERISNGISTIRGEAEAMQAQHESNIKTINNGLASLEKRQVAAGQSAAEVSKSLKELVEFASNEMQHQRKSILELSDNAEAIATHAAEQREKLESSNMLIIETLEKIHGSFSSFEALVFYIGVTVFCFLLSSTPRTSAARLPTMMCMASSLMLENWMCRTHAAQVEAWLTHHIVRAVVLFVSRSPMSTAFLTTEYHAVWCLRHLWLLLVVACFMAAILRFEHPEALQRRIVREELEKYLSSQEQNTGKESDEAADVEEKVVATPKSAKRGGRKKATKKSTAATDEDGD